MTGNRIGGMRAMAIIIIPGNGVPGSRDAADRGRRVGGEDNPFGMDQPQLAGNGCPSCRGGDQPHRTGGPDDGEGPGMGDLGGGDNKMMKMLILIIAALVKMMMNGQQGNMMPGQGQEQERSPMRRLNQEVFAA